MPNNFVSVKKKTIIDYIYAEKVQNFVFVIFLASLFTYALIWGYGDNQLRLISPFIVIFALYYMFNPGVDIRIFDFESLMLFITFFLIAIFKFIKQPLMNEVWDYTYYAWLFPILYYLGKSVTATEEKDFESKIKTVLFVLAFAMFIQGLLNYSMLPSTADGSYASVGFWNRDKWWSRSTWDTGFAMMFGSVFYAIYINKKDKLFSLILLALTVLGLVINLRYHGRTGILLIALVLSMMTILYIVAGNKLSNRTKTIIISIVVVILAIICIAVLLIKLNFAGIASIYEESFLNRDGGILNNVRFRWAKEGLINIFINGKGGWGNSEVSTTHNSWTEYGRMFDIIVFIFIVLFLIISIVKDIILIYRYGKKYAIAYMAVGGKMGLMIVATLNPDFYNCFDMMSFLVLISGITSGILYSAESRGYGILKKRATDNNYKVSVSSFGILMFALMAASYMDWWNDRLNIFYVMIIPVSAFLLGAMIKNSNWKNISLAVASVCSIFIAIYMYFLSRSSGLLAQGYYINPFTKGNTLQSSFVALWIIPASVLIGFVFYKVKLNKIIAAIGTVFAATLLLRSQIIDGRLAIIKEAFRLLYCVTCKQTTDIEKEIGFSLELGTPWVYSKENYLGLMSSHNMWLDFARDYGVIVFGLLLGVEAICIIAFVKMLLNDDRHLYNYILIVAFILFNYHFAIEATGFSDRYIFVFGMFIYGMLTSSTGFKHRKES